MKLVKEQFRLFLFPNDFDFQPEPNQALLIVVNKSNVCNWLIDWSIDWRLTIIISLTYTIFLHVQ